MDKLDIVSFTYLWLSCTNFISFCRLSYLVHRKIRNKYFFYQRMVAQYTKFYYVKILLELLMAILILAMPIINIFTLVMLLYIICDDSQSKYNVNSLSYYLLCRVDKKLKNHESTIRMRMYKNINNK